MRKSLLYIVIASLCMVGCKKNSTTVTTPTGTDTTHTTPIVAPVYTSAKMNGIWMWIGKAVNSTAPNPPDAFMQFSVTVLSDTSLLVLNDTLLYKSIDSAAHEITFYHIMPGSAHLVDQTLYYNTSDNSMKYTSRFNHSYGGGTLNVTTSGYIPNPSVKDHLPNIIGTKAMSGTIYDTLIFGGPDDTLYHESGNLTFTAVNDSTITFDIDVLGLGDTVLHYRSTDNAAKTITFQTFHSYDYMLSTLTYNYVSGLIIFEQRSRTTGQSKYLRMQ